MFSLNKKKTEKPKIIIVAGFAGSGKSTIGKLISEKLKIPYLDKDTLTRYFTDQMLTEDGSGKGDRESSYYSEVINPLEYDTLIKVAVENIELGISVVLSAPFIRQLNDSSWFKSKIESFSPISNFEVKLIWIESSREVERVRLIDRDAERDQNKLENWETYCDSVNNIKIESEYKKYTFYNLENNIENIENQINDLIKWLTK
jgi:predicted kinase